MIVIPTLLRKEQVIMMALMTMMMMMSMTIPGIAMVMLPMITMAATLGMITRTVIIRMMTKAGTPRL